MDTPDISHLTSSDYENVYEPAEDSFLLLDALEAELPALLELKPSICLEVGCGSGIISTALSKYLNAANSYSCLCLATDINPLACSIAGSTARQNRTSLEVVTTDLLSALVPRLEGQIDILVFNPPYVPTPTEETKGNGIEASYAGGVKGREITDRLLPLVPKLLSEKGFFYLLAIEENDVESILEDTEGFGLEGEICMERRAGREYLYILKFCLKAKG